MSIEILVNTKTQVQNIITEVLGNVTNNAQLTISNNLSDLNNAATARSNLGLGNVNNTSDANKPVSTATQTALNAKYNNPTGTPDGTKFLRDDNTWQPVPAGGGITFKKVYAINSLRI